jgi:hypothetical protein
MRISKKDASQLTRRQALGLLGTAAGAGFLRTASGLVASAAGSVPVQVQQALKDDLDPSALAATLSFF